MAEIARQTLKHDFRTIDPAQSRIVLLEAGPRVLPTFPEELSASAVEQPQRWAWRCVPGPWSRPSPQRGTHRPGTGRPSRRAPRCKRRGAGLVAPAHPGPPVGPQRAGDSGADLISPWAPRGLRDRRRRSLHAPGGRPLPGVAQVAIQGAPGAPENIGRTKGPPRRSFCYRNLGNMATIGAGRRADLGWLALRAPSRCCGWWCTSSR